MTDGPAEAALSWFRDAALPLWSRNGLDRVRGGFHEALDQAGRPVGDYRRLRVVSRQLYVFSAALRLGFEGAGAGLDHGLHFLRSRALHADGGYASRFDLDGIVIDETRDLYDLAFVAFALANAFDVTGDETLRDDAHALAAFLDKRMRHAAGGFVEALPVRLPRRQNPHMHLFEAALAWSELDPDGPYPAVARELADVFRERLFQPRSGTLPEQFDDRLMPISEPDGWVIEPGHHFEWVWLIHHAERLDLMRSGDIAGQLMHFAKSCGMDCDSGLPLGEVRGDGSPGAAPTRLWAVAEWLKAEAVTDGPDREARIGRAWEGLRRYLDTPRAGLWHERWCHERHGFLEGPAPATSLYHVVLAIETVLETAGRHPSPFGRRRQ